VFTRLLGACGALFFTVEQRPCICSNGCRSGASALDAQRKEIASVERGMESSFGTASNATLCTSPGGPLPDSTNQHLSLHSTSRPGYHLSNRFNSRSPHPRLPVIRPANPGHDRVIDSCCLSRQLLRYHRHVVCTPPSRWPPATRQSHLRGLPACTPAITDSVVACSRLLRDILQVDCPSWMRSRDSR
jgi:hypothetical protein